MLGLKTARKERPPWRDFQIWPIRLITLNDFPQNVVKVNELMAIDGLSRNLDWLSNLSILNIFGAPAGYCGRPLR